MKILVGLLISFLFLSTTAQAEVLRLKNGNTVEGQVVEEQDDLYVMLVDGFMVTYYKDEVEKFASSWSELEPKNGDVNSVDVNQTDDEKSATVDSSTASAILTDDDMAQVASSPFQLTPTEMGLIKNMEKRELILKFMDVFGTRATLKASYEQMFQQMTPEQIDEVKNSVTVEDIVDQLVPLYSKYFTENELRTYIGFYSSVEGRKLLRNIPLLMTDSVKTSMEYLESRLPDSVK